MTVFDQFCRYALFALALLVPAGTLLPLHSYRPMEAIVLLGLLPFTLMRQGPIMFPSVIRWSFWIGIAGWAVSTVHSSAPVHSFDVGALEFLTFYVLLYLFLAHLRDRHSLFTALTMFVCGVLIISIYQATVLIDAAGLPFPRSASDFIEYKKIIPVIFKNGISNTYGNTDNYISLWTLLMPLLAGLIYVVRPRWLVALAFLILAYCGLLAYSRIGLAVIMLAFLILAAFRAYAFRKHSVALYSIVAVLIFIHLDTKSLGYLYGGASSIASVITEENQETLRERPVTPSSERTVSPQPSGSNQSPGPPEPASADGAPALPLALDVRDASAVERGIAWRYGIAIGIRHWLAGIGYGLYQQAEQTYTAPHNMALSRFAEGGILSLISFLLLAAYAPTNLARIIRQKSSMLSASCTVAVSAFMLKAILFGASFAISSNFVWAFGVALVAAMGINAETDASANS